MYDSPLLRRPLDPPGRLFGSRLTLGGPGGLRYSLPSTAGPAPSPYPAFDEWSVPKLEPPDAPQVALPGLGVTNAAWMADNPLFTLTTEFPGTLPFMSQTTPGEGVTLRPSLQVAVRDRLWRNAELGVFGGFGGKVPFGAGKSTGTGVFGFSLHLGPEQPKEDAVKYGTGLWLSLAQGWGAEPDVPFPPQGWSFNPNFNAMVSHSWMRPDKWGFDIVWGAGISRWGAVNDVTAATVFSPFLGVNYSRNLGKHDTLNWEATFGPNLGLGGRYGAPAGSGMPVSLGLNVGLFGWQHTWGDYGFGLEPWIFAEPWSNVANTDATFRNVGGGLRLDFGAINPRREHVEPVWPH